MTLRCSEPISVYEEEVRVRDFSHLQLNQFVGQQCPQISWRTVLGLPLHSVCLLTQ